MLKGIEIATEKFLIEKLTYNWKFYLSEETVSENCISLIENCNVNFDSTR